MFKDRIFQSMQSILGNKGIASKGEIDSAGNVIFVGMGNGIEVEATIPEVDTEDEIGPKAAELADLIDRKMAGQ